MTLDSRKLTCLCVPRIEKEEEGYHDIIAKQIALLGLIWYGFNLKHGSRQLVNLGLYACVDSKSSQSSPYDATWKPQERLSADNGLTASFCTHT
jgi:hypothetical protein